MHLFNITVSGFYKRCCCLRRFNRFFFMMVGCNAMGIIVRAPVIIKSVLIVLCYALDHHFGTLSLAKKEHSNKDFPGL